MPALPVSPARLATGALVVAALPVAFLLGGAGLALALAAPGATDDGATFSQSLGDDTGAEATIVHLGDGGDLPGTGTDWGQVLSAVATSPALVTSCVGLAVLAALTVAGTAVPRGVRVAGVVTAALVAALAAVTAVVVGSGALQGAGGTLVLTAAVAVRDAPATGSLVAETVFAALAGLALVRRRERA
ncbi:hypothetical protein ACFEMC_07305 [Kineococcus sp. DHX-1]|uniref:hypothetical protein n=1 Tax=Kineococcus sp. DHX-1 TaxID=3349638 RepID=UPI0036D2E79C